MTTDDGRRSVAPAAAIAAVICGFTLLWIAIGRSLGFYTLLNDFWGPFFLADHLSLADPRTLHNGFFPIGYPLLLRVLRDDQILVIAYVTSVASAVALMGAVYAWLSSRVSAWIAVAGCAAIGAQPLFFVHAITTGPDMPATLLATAGALLLAAGVEQRRWPTAVVAGAALGLAGLFRYHGFALGGAALAGAALVWPRHWRTVAAAAMAFGALGGVQVAANLLAGVPPFKTAQAFNVYKMFNPIDWWHLSVSYPDSVIGVIRLSPERFRAAYWDMLRPSLHLIAPALAAGLLPGRHRRAAWFLALTAAIYLPVQAIGGSPRGPLPIVPLFIVAIALCLERIVDWPWHASVAVRRAAALAAGAVVLAVALSGWIPENRAALGTFRETADLWARVEAALRADGVRHPAQIFTDNFDFYFTSVRSRRSFDYRARNTGGWAQIDLYGYTKVHPPARLTTLEEFLEDLRGFGVTHLLLTANARHVLAALGPIQAGAPLPPGLRPVADLGGLRIVALAR